MCKQCRPRAVFSWMGYIIWAATWQNHQNGCAPSEDSVQPGHPPSLIRVFTVRLMGSWGPKLSSCGQRRLWSDWADAQTDLSLRWAHTHFAGFLMMRLKCRTPVRLRGLNALVYVKLHWLLAEDTTKTIFIYIWATSIENVSSEIFDQVTFKPACSATEAS